MFAVGPRTKTMERVKMVMLLTMMMMTIIVIRIIVNHCYCRRTEDREMTRTKKKVYERKHRLHINMKIT